MKVLPLSSLRKAPLGASGILPHRLLGLGKSLSVLRVCSLNRQYLREHQRHVDAALVSSVSKVCCGRVRALTEGARTERTEARLMLHLPGRADTSALLTH